MQTFCWWGAHYKYMSFTNLFFTAYEQFSRQLKSLDKNVLSFQRMQLKVRLIVLNLDILTFKSTNLEQQLFENYEAKHILPSNQLCFCTCLHSNKHQLLNKSCLWKRPVFWTIIWRKKFVIIYTSLFEQ